MSSATSGKPTPIGADAAKGAGYARLWYRAAVGTAAVAGVFSLVVAAILVADCLQSRRLDPREHKQLKELRETLGGQPNDAELKGRIRALDLRVRKQYFHLAGLAQSEVLILNGMAPVVGALNFSRIDNAVLILTLQRNIGIVCIQVWGINYNVLRILAGMGGLAYSN